MPGYLLHEGASVICSHGGQAQAIIKNPRVKVNGRAIVMRTSPYRITGCPNPPPTASTGPCQIANWVSAATRVRASKMPVLLRDSQAQCIPTPVPLRIIATQMRVKGI